MDKRLVYRAGDLVRFDRSLYRRPPVPLCGDFLHERWPQPVRQVGKQRCAKCKHRAFAGSQGG